MFQHGVNRHFARLFAAAFHLLPLILVPPDLVAQQTPPQPPTQEAPIDLTGDWTDKEGRTYSIVQTDNDIILRTQTGEEFKGSIDRDKITLRHTLSKKTVAKGFPDWLEEALVGEEVLVQGT